jgi:ATP-dependent Clp protease ATP-binding subunit ClpA
VYQRFTNRALRVLVLAQDEARFLGDAFIGTEHLLLGLFGEKEGAVGRALEQLSVSEQAVREKVAEMSHASESDPTDSLAFTPRMKTILELSLRESRFAGREYIGTEHLLLGMVREGHGAAMKVLERLGTDPRRVREQVLSVMSVGRAYDNESHDPTEGTFTIRVRRERHPLDRFRNWNISLDRKVIRSIEPDETSVLTVPAGTHALRVDGRWQTSYERQVSGQSGDVFGLVCRPRRRRPLAWPPFGIGSRSKHDLFYVEWP